MKTHNPGFVDTRRKFGLIGFPISHSFSPGYFREKFEKEGISDARYDLYPLPRIEDINELIPEDIVGLNVTIPYKERVIPFLDDLSPEAEEIGAVNTILFENGKKKGFNTDIYGFEKSLIRLCGEELPGQALILGTGGASKAVIYVLERQNVQCHTVSRTKGDLSYDQLDRRVIEKSLLIINTTPLGMYPEVSKCPNIPYEYITEKHHLYDLIYNPEKSLFLDRGVSQGAKVKGGLEMLKLQAEKSWMIWNHLD